MNDNQFDSFKAKMALYGILTTLFAILCGGIIGYFTAIETVICK